MKSALALVPLAFAALACAPPASATGTINRCEARDGTLVFTDQQCHLLGVSYALAGDTQPIRRDRPGMKRVGAANGGFRFGIGCAARTPEGMIGAVRRALESGDPNQLAGLYDWTGASRGHANGVMRSFQRLVERDLLTVEFDYEDYTIDGLYAGLEGSSSPPAQPALPDVVVAHYAWGTGDESEQRRFELTRSKGCLWLAG